MDIVFGLLAVGIGAAVCFAGLRLWFWLLPVLGFVVGFVGGAALVTWLFGDGFLSTALGIIVGIALGIGAGLISYLWWYIGAILAAGSAGSALGTTLFATIGIDSSVALFIIGLLFAAVFIVGALILALPIYIVVVNTALAGATIIIAGLLLMFDEVQRSEIGTMAAWERIDGNWVLWLGWVVLAGAGIAAQLSMIRRVTLPDERWSRVPAAA
ncbi:MAG TPA: DUF4203 domain-containing protein [Thermomicrobiales bacterium]|nr:DUF4203 domain-containing protein [Thermomicrobiales bacterium]